MKSITSLSLVAALAAIACNDGSPVREDTLAATETCAVDAWGEVPEVTGYDDAGCASRYLEAFDAPLVSAETVAVPESELCSLTGLRRQAVDLYRGYWDYVDDGFDAMVSRRDGEELIFEVTERVTSRGREIRVSTGNHGLYDVSAVYDGDGELLALYNWDPDEIQDYGIYQLWFCAEDAEDAEPEPPGRCSGDPLLAGPPDEAWVATEEGVLSLDELESLPTFASELLQLAVADFYERHGLDGAASASYQLRSWDEPVDSPYDDLEGAVIALNTGAVVETLHVANGYLGVTLVAVDDGSGPAMVCEVLE